MIFYILAAFAALIWLWMCFRFYGARAQWSPTIRRGGTVVFAIATLAASVVAYQAFTKSEQLSSTPTSFEESGLANQKWRPDQLPLAASVTAGRLGMLHDDLVWAMSLSDKIRARLLAAESSSIEAQWRNQDPAHIANYQACLQAAAHISAGVAALQQGEKTWPKAEFGDTVARCRSAGQSAQKR